MRFDLFSLFCSWFFVAVNTSHTSKLHKPIFRPKLCIRTCIFLSNFLILKNFIWPEYICLREDKVTGSMCQSKFTEQLTSWKKQLLWAIHRYVKVNFDIQTWIATSAPFNQLIYRPFHKTLPRSNAFVNWISVRFYETGCSWMRSPSLYPASTKCWHIVQLYNH